MSGEEEEEGGPLRELLDVDRTIHEPARLAILAHLMAVESADFLYLRRVTGLTAGNISSHLSRLEEQGLVSVKKEFQGRRPRTLVRLSAAGRRALQRYVRTMASALEVIGIE